MRLPGRRLTTGQKEPIRKALPMEELERDYMGHHETNETSFEPGTGLGAQAASCGSLLRTCAFIAQKDPSRDHRVLRQSLTAPGRLQSSEVIT